MPSSPNLSYIVNTSPSTGTIHHPQSLTQHCHSEFHAPLTYRMLLPTALFLRPPHNQSLNCTLHAQWLCCYSSSIVMELPLFLLGILQVPFKHFPITIHMNSGGTINILVNFRWALSTHHCHRLFLSWWCCHCLDRETLWLCCILDQCNSWTILCNVLHIVAAMGFLSSHPICAVMFLLIIWITTLTLTASIRNHPWLLSLLQILLPAVCLKHWQYGCHLWHLLLLKSCFVGFHLCHNLFLFVSQGVDLVVNQLTERPPIIIHRYALHHIEAVLTHYHCTCRTLHTEVTVVPMLPNLLCKILHIVVMPHSAADI